MSPKKKFPASGYFVFGVALCAVVIGMILTYSGQGLLKLILKNTLVLAPGSKVFNIWEKPPIDLPMNFYFFNWTNPEDIYNSSVKPKFVQVGPYKFMESQKKTNIVWNKNGTVSFERLKFWRHLDGEDAGNLQDNITSINPVALATAHVSRNWNIFIRKGASLVLSRIAPTINITHSVNEILFDGYPDTLITIAKTFPFFADQDLPKWDKFGWFYQRNGSSFLDGSFTMGTGKNSSFGSLFSWNHWTRTPYYKDQCADVGPSYLEVFEPYQNKNFITLFSPEACRKIRLQFAGKSKVEGITGNKYIAGDYMFDNGTKYPENKCFCSGDCLPAGVFNVSSCRFGTPAFVSLPHFYKADPYYKNLVEGVEPEAEKHDFFVTLEPTTGIPLEIVVRLQLNLFLQPIKGVTMYENVPHAFFPVVWFEQKLKIPGDQIFLLKLLLNLPLTCSLIGIIVTLLGLLLFVYGFCKYFDMRIFTRTNDNKYSYQFETVPLQKE